MQFESAVNAARKPYASRSAARNAARSEGFEHFRCEFDHKKGAWFFRVGLDPHKPTVEYAKGKDWIHHVEAHRNENGPCGVCVVNITKQELDLELETDPAPEGTTFEPLTRDLWDEDAPATKRMTSTGPRARSEAESPVKTVWRIADEMKGKPRADVIAACVAAGVNKATASTQFYRWQKAQGA